MIQHLALKVPEKAEYRHNASDAIVELALRLPKASAFSKIVHWFVQLVHNEKSAHRYCIENATAEVVKGGGLSKKIFSNKFLTP